MTVQRHSHSWLWWDWEKISYNDLTNKPAAVTPVVPVVYSYSKALIFQRDSTVWIWIQSFTWFWFTPTNYTISSWTTWWSTWQWGYDWTLQKCLYVNSYLWYDTGIATRVIHLRDWASVKTYAGHSSFWSDWVSLSFSNSDIDATLIITCFG